MVLLNRVAIALAVVLVIAFLVTGAWAAAATMVLVWLFSPAHHRRQLLGREQ